MLTDRAACAARKRSLVETVRLAVDAGARAVVLREKDLSAGERELLGRELLGVLRPAGGMLIVASDAELAQRLGAAGVHLSTHDAFPGGEGESPPGLIGRSCHSRAEVRKAAAEHVSYVTASPVFASASKPGYGPELTANGLARLVADARGVPVLALGGVTAAGAVSCRRAGAHGVAVMGAIMGSDHPFEATAALLG